MISIPPRRRRLIRLPLNLVLDALARFSPV
jgi:hypothetical protein